MKWIVLIALLGCGNKKEAPPAADKPVADKPAEPFKGPLTIDAVMSAKDVVKGFDPWDAGFAKLQAKLGPPTKVDGTTYSWAVQQGDDCAYVYVSKDDAKKLNYGEGFVVGTVASPMKVGKDAPSGNRDACLAILGKDAGPPEDPSAAPPPADGKATVALVLDNAVKARSKWKGAKVTLSGNVTSISTTASGGQSWTTLTLADDKDKTKTLDCTLHGDSKVTSGKPVKVSGTVEVEKWTSGKGDEYKPALKDCAVAQ